MSYLKQEKPEKTLFYIVGVGILALPSAIWEEALFRVIPLWLVRKKSVDIQITVVLISSFIFGYHFGDIRQIPYQGVLGILLSVIYLKSGGAQGKVLKPYLAVVCMHTLFNWIVCVIMLIAFARDQ